MRPEGRHGQPVVCQEAGSDSRSTRSPVKRFQKTISGINEAAFLFREILFQAWPAAGAIAPAASHRARGMVLVEIVLPGSFFVPASSFFTKFKKVPDGGFLRHFNFRIYRRVVYGHMELR